MAWLTTRITMTTVSLKIAGPDSTVVATDGASVSDPVHTRLLNLVPARWHITNTSARTTVSSHILPGFNVTHLVLTADDDIWGWTSNGATVNVVITGGGQG